MTAAVLLAAALSAPSWTLVYEKPGLTNTVTAADNPTAIAVELVRAGDQWSGKIVNREPGATVLAFEFRSEEIPVDVQCDRLYLPWEEGARIKVWPKADQAASADATVDAFVSEFDKEYAANPDFWVRAGGDHYLFDPRMHVQSARGAMQRMTLSHGTRGS